MFVPVVDNEKSRSERDDDAADLQQHRRFDNPHGLHAPAASKPKGIVPTTSSGPTQLPCHLPCARSMRLGIWPSMRVVIEAFCRHLGEAVVALSIIGAGMARHVDCNSNPTHSLHTGATHTQSTKGLTKAANRR